MSSGESLGAGPETGSKTARLEARVAGTVQGVGFRWFVRERALSLGLTGHVKNEYDGSVEVVAEGPRETLEGFLAALRVGPRSAVVRDVAVRWVEPTGAFALFEVRP